MEKNLLGPNLQYAEIARSLQYESFETPTQQPYLLTVNHVENKLQLKYLVKASNESGRSSNNILLMQ